MKKLFNNIFLINTIVNIKLCTIGLLYKQHTHELGLLKTVVSDLLEIATYMLHTRFLQAKGKAKIKVANTNSPELNQFLGIETKKQAKVAELLPLDVIKFFKLLENFLLKRTFIFDWTALKLGSFEPIAERIIHTLPTLLLAVEQIGGAFEAAILNLLFSVNSLYRLFSVKTVPNITTVEAEYTGENFEGLKNTLFSVSNVTEWLNRFLNGFNLLAADIRIVIYSGNASSPNGGASSNNLFTDVAAVLKDPKLLNAIKAMSKFFKNGSEFMKLFDALASHELAKANGIHSRLFHFTAPGGKARIIANVDWVTQTALSAIHYLLFAILKFVSADFTFDHKAAIAYLMDCEDFKNQTSGYTFYSIDLSAATDRMPRILQAQIIVALFNMLNMDGQAIANAWLSIIDRWFDVSSMIKNGKPVRYAVGQGMGLFTSWPIMAMMHHYIINGICGVPMSRYVLVGDDLLFFGTREEYRKYIETMAAIGVEVNLGKTVVSPSADKPTIEFARNFWINGNPIIPIPWGMIFAWNDNVLNFETLLWAMLKAVAFDELMVFIRTLNLNHFNDSNIRFQIGYWLWKECGIKLEAIISELGAMPKWFTLDNLEKIKAIILNSQKQAVSLFVNYIDASFMANYNSQCVVRTIDEKEFNIKIANIVKTLAILDANLLEASELIQRRFNSTEVIKYDTDLSGSPLLSKKEIKLLVDINKLEKP